MNRFAIILTHNRPELLRETWKAIGPQVELVIVIDNASDPPVDATELHAQTWSTALCQVPDQPPNLARLWNVGLEFCRNLTGPDGRVAVLCDDAPPPAGWFDVVSAAMTEHGAVLGCSTPGTQAESAIIKREPDSDLWHRATGWAWVLDLTTDLRADEQFEWWWCDTDLDWRARQSGGMVMIGSHPVPNQRPNDFTATKPGCAEQAGQDGLRFVAKWGWRPW